MRSRATVLRWLRRPPSAPGAMALCASVVALALVLASPVALSPRKPLPAPAKVASRTPRTRAAAAEPGAAATVPGAAATPPGAAPAAQPATMMHVLFVGASITSGMEQSSLDDTYPGRVVGGLRNQGYRVDWQERARWGALAADALTWPYPPDQQFIAVHLITNDFVRGTPIDSYQDALGQVLADLRAGSPQAHLLCLGVWGAPNSVNLNHVSLAAYDAAAQQTCESEQGAFIPLDRIFATAGSRGPVGQVTPWGPTDGWHPNDVGAQRIADAVLATIPPESAGWD
jgi:lysophospholipase L1-like esterase